MASQEKFVLECADCNYIFKTSRPDKNGIFICPVCGSYNVDIVDSIRPQKDTERI